MRDDDSNKRLDNAAGGGGGILAGQSSQPLVFSLFLWLDLIIFPRSAMNARQVYRANFEVGCPGGKRRKLISPVPSNNFNRAAFSGRKGEEKGHL